MPFTSLGLHADLLKGIRELGFTRPTPIQEQAIPPALEGRDLLACAQTGSGKTAAFLLPILHRLIGKPRRVTRALILTPTRELAAQILEDFNALAVHTPLTGAAVYGGVGMGPQEHAFRSGVDVIVATPGRLLDHARAAVREARWPRVPRARRSRPHARHGLPARHQAHPAPHSGAPADAVLQRDDAAADRRAGVGDAEEAGDDQRAAAVGAGRRASRRRRIRCRRISSRRCCWSCSSAKILQQALVFTRTKHRANRLADYLVQQGIKAERIHGNRSQSQRTQALAGFKSGRYPVLVATDIAARGIDVEALSHVVNFDVPAAPDDYIHRVGRTGRAEMTGEAFTFVAPQDEGDWRAIERAIGRSLPRVTLPDFNYQARATKPLEIPHAQRIAEIRARKAEERAARGRTRSGGAPRAARSPHQPSSPACRAFAACRSAARRPTSVRDGRRRP